VLGSLTSGNGVETGRRCVTSSARQASKLERPLSHGAVGAMEQRPLSPKSYFDSLLL
jgi:hypothetical protein